MGRRFYAARPPEHAGTTGRPGPLRPSSRRPARPALGAGRRRRRPAAGAPRTRPATDLGVGERVDRQVARGRREVSGQGEPRPSVASAALAERPSPVSKKPPTKAAIPAAGTGGLGPPGGQQPAEPGRLEAGHRAGPVAQGVVDRRRSELSDSSSAIGVARRGGPARRGRQVGRRQGLLDADQPEGIERGQSVGVVHSAGPPSR